MQLSSAAFIHYTTHIKGGGGVCALTAASAKCQKPDPDGALNDAVGYTPDMHPRAGFRAEAFLPTSRALAANGGKPENLADMRSTRSHLIRALRGAIAMGA